MTQQQLDLRSQRLKERELEEKERANRKSESLKEEDQRLEADKLGMEADKAMLARKGFLSEIAAPLTYLSLSTQSRNTRNRHYSKNPAKPNAIHNPSMAQGKE